MFDKGGNLFISDINLNRIIKIDTSLNATTVAGNEMTGFSGDGGLALNAELNLPDRLAVDSAGALYIADQLNHRVRKLFQLVLSTVAGTADKNGGAASAAFLDLPDGIAVSGSNTLAVADSGNREVRKFTPGGTINAIGQVNGTKR